MPKKKKTSQINFAPIQKYSKYESLWMHQDSDQNVPGWRNSICYWILFSLGMERSSSLFLQSSDVVWSSLDSGGGKTCVSTTSAGSRRVNCPIFQMVIPPWACFCTARHLLNDLFPEHPQRLWTTGCLWFELKGRERNKCRATRPTW